MTTTARDALADAIKTAIMAEEIGVPIPPRELYRRLAAAVLALVGPKPLAWVKHPTKDIWRCDTNVGTYKVFGIGQTPSWDFDGNDGQISNVSQTVAAAQSAAQAHADAAHWANTALGDLIGGEG